MPRSLQPGKLPRPLTRKEVLAFPPSADAYFHARVAIVGGGVAGLGAAWALNRHPDRFDFHVFEAEAHLGGNAVTADMPQDDGTSIPFDISVTACIPSVYHHILLVARQLGIELVDTRFSYSVAYRGGIYAHDLDCDIHGALRPEIEKFQRLLRRLNRFGRLNRSRSRLAWKYASAEGGNANTSLRVSGRGSFPG